MSQWPVGKKTTGLLCFLPSTEGGMLRLTPADPNEQSGEVAKSLEAVLGSEWSAALSSTPWQLSTWNVTALENCTSAVLSSRNVLGSGQNPTDFGGSWKSLISP